MPCLGVNNTSSPKGQLLPRSAPLSAFKRRHPERPRCRDPGDMQQGSSVPTSTYTCLVFLFGAFGFLAIALTLPEAAENKLAASRLRRPQKPALQLQNRDVFEGRKCVVRIHWKARWRLETVLELLFDDSWDVFKMLTSPSPEKLLTEFSTFSSASSYLPPPASRPASRLLTHLQRLSGVSALNTLIRKQQP